MPQRPERVFETLKALASYLHQLFILSVCGSSARLNSIVKVWMSLNCIEKYLGGYEIFQICLRLGIRSATLHKHRRRVESGLSILQEFPNLCSVNLRASYDSLKNILESVSIPLPWPRQQLQCRSYEEVNPRSLFHHCLLHHFLPSLQGHRLERYTHNRSWRYWVGVLVEEEAKG